MSVFRKLLGVFLAALLLGGALKVGGDLKAGPEIQGTLKPEAVHREAAEEIVDRLDLHYRRLKFDDDLSARVLEQYLKDLDPNRLYFTRQDIDDFQVYRDQLDDQLGDGELEAGYTIFNRFQTRLEARLTEILADIEAGFDDWSFDGEEDVLVDRGEADWAADEAALDAIWRRQLKNAVLSMRLNGTEDEAIQERLTNRYESQLNRVRQNTAEDVFQTYMNALAQSFDPHTNYFTPHNSENFDISMSRSLEGIGAVLQYEDGYTKVVRLVPGGPAAKHGQLKPADRIVAVAQGDDDMVNVIGMRLDEVVDMIRGPKDSEVRLEVIPAGSASEHDTRTIAITRNKVVLEEQAAKKEVIEFDHGGDTVKLGVIEIPAFYMDFNAFHRGDPNYTSTTRDVAELLVELRKENVDGLVIDLRNNGGGSLQEANELTGLFIEYGPTVQIRHSSRRVWRDGKRMRTAYYDGPLVVLINRLSASASEIFAGAIQDYERGIIVGDRSFGKGTVQTLVPLTEGQLKITESKFYRISGDSTQHRGVVPDITFPSLYDPEDIGESSLEHALSWDQINPVRHRRYGDLDPLIPELSALFQERSASDPDFNFLVDRVALADENDDIQVVSLNEETRRAEREAREARALAIENKRRQALGEEPLASFDDDEEDSAGEDGVDPEDGEEEGEDEADVLLSEAGNILVDALLMRKQAYAIHSPEEE